MAHKYQYGTYPTRMPDRNPPIIPPNSNPAIKRE